MAVDRATRIMPGAGETSAIATRHHGLRALHFPSSSFRNNVCGRSGRPVGNVLSVNTNHHGRSSSAILAQEAERWSK